MGYTQQEAFTTINDDDSFNIAAQTYFAASWTAGATYTLTQLAISLQKVGSPTGNMTAYIYTGASTLPVTEVATSTNTPAASTVLVSPGGLIDFTFAGQAISSGTQYWAVVYWPYNATNYIQYLYSDSGTGNMARAPDGSTWTNDQTACQGAFITYSTSAGGMNQVQEAAWWRNPYAKYFDMNAGNWQKRNGIYFKG